MSELFVVDLGTQPYASALELQRDVARRRIAGEIAEDVLLLVEHPPVVTLGRTAKGNNLIASPEYLASQGVELFEVERGGDGDFTGRYGEDSGSVEAVFGSGLDFDYWWHWSWAARRDP